MNPKFKELGRLLQVNNLFFYVYSFCLSVLIGIGHFAIFNKYSIALQINGFPRWELKGNPV